MFRLRILRLIQPLTFCQLLATLKDVQFVADKILVNLGKLRRNVPTKKREGQGFASLPLTVFPDARKV